jgi:hypothetical protein
MRRVILPFAQAAILRVNAVLSLNSSYTGAAQGNHFESSD